jgi:hypothetical protein
VEGVWSTIRESEGNPQYCSCCIRGARRRENGYVRGETAFPGVPQSLAQRCFEGSYKNAARSRQPNKLRIDGPMRVKGMQPTKRAQYLCWDQNDNNGGQSQQHARMELMNSMCLSSNSQQDVRVHRPDYDLLLWNQYSNIPRGCDAKDARDLPFGRWQQQWGPAGGRCAKSCPDRSLLRISIPTATAKSVWTWIDWSGLRSSRLFQVCGWPM